MVFTMLDADAVGRAPATSSERIAVCAFIVNLVVPLKVGIAAATEKGHPEFMKCCPDKAV